MSVEQENVSIDEALASGDPELMEKALAEFGEGTDVFTAETVVADEEGEEAEDESTVSTTAEDEEAQRVVKSKDGKHEIPYSVLESERNQRKQLEQELAEMRAKHAETESALNNVKARLEEQGADVEEMFSNPDEITEQQWQEIEDDYGALGKMMKQLMIAQKSNQQATTHSSEVAADQKAFNDALNAMPELSKWQTSDADRWSEATRIDSELRSKPEWANKTYTERFAEVERLVKKAFGDDVAEAKARAKQSIEKQTDSQVPTSLSDMGGSPVQHKDDMEALRDLSPEEIEARMATMTPAQVEKMFASGF